MRDSVKRAMDVATTARMDVQIDRNIESSARQIEAACNRFFYPSLATRYFDWPTNYYGSGGRPWQIWLDANELISVSAVTAGPVSIPLGDVNLEPVNYGPPYTRLEINLASAASFSGAPTWQRAVGVTGLYGFTDDETPAGVVTGSLTNSQPTAVVSDSSLLSPGALVRVDAERMQVTDATMVTTGVTFTGPITASAADVLLDVGASVSAFAVGETILLDAERMLVVDVSGTRLVVKRGWDGSVLATHSTTLISAPRQLSLVRGFLGTTAATHSASAPLYRHTPPAMVESANVGLALYKTTAEKGGLRPIPLAPAGAEGGKAKRTASPVDALLTDLVQSYGRQARTRAI